MRGINNGYKVLASLSHLNEVNQVVYTKDDSRILVSCYNRLLYLYETTGYTEIAKLVGHTGGVLTSNYNSDDSLIVSGGTDFKIIIWDASNNTHKKTLIGHSTAVRSVIYTDND